MQGQETLVTMFAALSVVVSPLKNPKLILQFSLGRYWSTLARDVPVAGLMVTCYEALKDLTEYGKRKWFPNSSFQVNSSFEWLVLGGIAGGVSAYLTTPLDVIKTRLQLLIAGAAGGIWAYGGHRRRTNVHLLALNLTRRVPLTPKERETMLEILTPPPPQGMLP